MKHVLAYLVVLCGACLWQDAASQPGASGRFVAVDVYLDSAAPVAAWQFEFGSRSGTMKVVGVENGESAAFERTPYYDRDAVRRGRTEKIIVADFSLADADRLPSGRTRIATLHLMLSGTDARAFELELVTAVSHDGRPVDASLSLQTRTGSEP